MAYVVVWTRKADDVYEDHYVVFGGEGEAQRAYRLLLEEESVWCAAITKVMDATEPHWIEDVSDSPTDGETE